MSLISVVVPCYNYGRFLADALESVRAQTHRDWECVVVDDGSTDDTREVFERVARADSRFRYLFQAHKGVSEARNTGLRAVHGEFVQLLDADDLLGARKLAEHHDYLQSRPDVDIVYGYARFFALDDKSELYRAPGREDFEWMDKAEGSAAEVLPNLVRANIMVIHAAFCRADVFRRAGLFDTSLGVFEDWEFWLRCAFSGCRFGYRESPDSDALVRWHPGGLSRNPLRMLQGEVLVRERIMDRLSGATRACNEQRRAEALARLGIEKMLAGSRREGAAQFLKGTMIARSKLRAARFALYLLLPPQTLRAWKRRLLR